MKFQVDRDRHPQWPYDLPWFVQGKLLLDFVWLALVVYPMLFLPHPPHALVQPLFPLLDALLLAPCLYWIRIRPHQATLALYVSVAITVVAITLTLSLAADFTSPGLILYFALLAVVAPFRTYVVAGLASISYLILAVAEMSGLVGAASGATPVELQEAGGWVPGVVAGLWFVAGSVARLVAAAQEERGEQVRLRSETDRRVEAEAIWSTVGKTVIATQDLDQVLTTVIQVINAKMQVETGSVLLREPGSTKLYFAKIMHGDEEQLASVHLQVGQGVAGWVAQTGQSTLVLDPARDERWFGEVDRRTGFTTRSILCVPLVVKNEIIGVIELLNKKSGSFAPDDVQLMESIAAPVAIAIQNARLHLQVQTQLEELTRLFHQVERAKQEWEHTIDAIDEGISLVDQEGCIQRANHTFAAWVHATPTALVGQYCHKVIHGLDAPPAMCPHARLIAEHDHSARIELDEPALGGSFLCTAYPLEDADGGLIGTVNVLKDITVEKRLQAHLIRSEKLAATGKLATSLAHEINNPLQGIQGCLDLAGENVAGGDRAQRYLTMAKSELERLTNIVRRILDLYRPSKAVGPPVDARVVLEDVLGLCAKRMQAADINVRMEWDRSLPEVHAGNDQIRQVFLNLVLNAIDAMPSGGELVIRNGLVEGAWLTIALTDTGVGIPSETLESIFDPFYTTKPEGTGLGLAVCCNILAGFGGRLTAESELDQGSTFTVWLPVR